MPPEISNMALMWAHCVTSCTVRPSIKIIYNVLCATISNRHSNNNLDVFACLFVLHTVVGNLSGVFGHYVVKFLLGWAEHPHSWALGRLQPTEWWETGRQWSEVTHIAFSWRALSCQAWFAIICHPVVAIGNATYSTKYACIRPGDRK